MSTTNFWKPVYQLFKPEEPLATAEDLRDFYVQRVDSPMEKLLNLLDMEDDPAKFLLAGHKGGGKTTELRWLEQKLSNNYTVVWINTEAALNRFNIGHAEVVVLIGFKIYQRAKESGWGISSKLFSALEDSLKTVVRQDKLTQNEGLGLPEVLEKLGIILKRGLTQESTKTLDVRPVLENIIKNVNTIIEEVQKERKQKLLIIVDGLDKHEYSTALEAFSSPLLAELNCHSIYSIPISLRYSPSFRLPMQSFQKCLDLTNPPVFECDSNSCPKQAPDHRGRAVLMEAIEKRLTRLDSNTYNGVFNQESLELLCVNSGGVMRDLMRLARSACEAALDQRAICVDLTAAEEAVKEVRKEYSLNDYHFEELDSVHRTGRLTTKTHHVPGQGEIVICDELLHLKHVLGYYNSAIGDSWFDVNPILMRDLERWQAINLSPP